MARYEVEIEVLATMWIDVEADNEYEAIQYAQNTYRIGDAQNVDIVATYVKKYAEKNTGAA